MDRDGFWELIELASSPEDLHRRLAELPEAEFADFEVHHEQVFVDSYDWSLWGAAYIIDGGCSDDGFDYFRAYLISLGRAVFDDALANPDSLAAVSLEDAEGWEDWMSPTLSVAKSRTGKYEYAAPDRHPARSSEPKGESSHGMRRTWTSASRA
jgi:hypothetical protein